MQNIYRGSEKKKSHAQFYLLIFKNDAKYNINKFYI